MQVFEVAEGIDDKADLIRPAAVTPHGSAGPGGKRIPQNPRKRTLSDQLRGGL